MWTSSVDLVRLVARLTVLGLLAGANDAQCMPQAVGEGRPELLSGGFFVVERDIVTRVSPSRISRTPLPGLVCGSFLPGLRPGAILTILS